MRRVWAVAYLVAALGGLGFTGCAAPQPVVPSDPAAEERMRAQAAAREAALVVYAEGVYLREAGRNRRALERFTDAVRLYPEDPVLRLTLTRQYLQLGAVQEAGTLLREFESRFELSAEEHLLAARLHVVGGRMEAASGELDAALAADSLLVDAWWMRGRLRLDEGRLDEALADLQRAAALQPYRAATHLSLAECYVRLGQRRKAELGFRRAIQFDPNLHAARTALAKLYRDEGQLDEAITVYQELLAREPTHEATVSTLLDLLLDTGRFEDAARLLQPRYADGVLDPRQQYIYGWLLLQLGDLDTAQLVLEPLAELRGARGVDALLGEVALRRARPEEARAYFKEAVRKQPDECSAYVSLAGVMIQELRDAEGRLDLSAAALDEVREVLSAATAVTPADEYRCNVLLGIAYSQLRDFAAALGHLEAGHALRPEEPDVVFNLAMAHQELGHFESALRYGRDVLALEPENPAALNFVGYILAERGIELEDSEQLIRRALQAEPDNGYYVDSLGWVFYRRGEYQQAAMELERAVALTDNKDPIILEHLGDAYVKMGRLDGAYRVYEQSRELAPANAALLDKIMDVQKRMGKP